MGGPVTPALSGSGGEIQLILQSARLAAGAEGPDSLATLARGVPDWARVLLLARAHGVVPLVHAAVCELPDVPAPVRIALASDFQRSAADAFLYARELVRLSRDLERNGVSAMALKGPALAMRLYGRLSLRQCRDLDLLVAKGDLRRACDALYSSGYRPVSKTGKDLLLVHPDSALKVELHWRISKPLFGFEMAFGDLWRRREQVTVLGSPVPAPCPEDLLLMLCAHGASHSWASLKWVCDIAELVRVCEIEWPRLFANSEKLGGRRMLLLGLALAKTMLGAALPPEAARELEADRSAMRLCEELRARLLAGPQPLGDVETALLYIRSRERFRDRLRLAARYVRPRLKPNMHDRKVVRLPGALRCLYWPVRIVRLGWLYRSEVAAPLWTSVVQPGPRA